jgi:hypothetical protein
MRIFTFSGIRGEFSGTNRGGEIIQLARDLAANLPSTAGAAYDGAEGADHFVSEINLGRLLGELGPATLLDGSPVLNEEARRVAPVAAAQLLQLAPADAAEPVVIIAHSQGTNNATFTLQRLLAREPGFFAARAVRCLFFDPKVGPDHVRDVFAQSAGLDLPFLFLQSERDLLSNQGVIGTRFIDQFHLGNHLYVAGLGHNDIEDWEVLEDPRLRWLTRPEYHGYIREVEKERLRLRQERGKPGWTTADELRVEKFKKAYAMNKGGLTPALLQFAQGRLAAKYES